MKKILLTIILATITLSSLSGCIFPRGGYGHGYDHGHSGYEHRH